MLYGVIAVAQIDQAKVPKGVQNAVQSKFSNADVLDWYKVDDGYEANLDEEGESISAVFNNEGAFLYTYTSVSEEEVPESIINSVYSKYPDSYISESFRLDLASGNQYKLTVDVDGKTMILIYDKSGKLVKSKEVAQEF